MNTNLELFSGAFGAVLYVMALILGFLWLFFPLILYVYIRRLDKSQRECAAALKAIQLDLEQSRFYNKQTAENTAILQQAKIQHGED
jgi:ABC-type tungstate transport system substrate-binding protein